MLIGTGIDIVEIARIAQSIARYGDHFLEKIFTAYHIDAVMHFAGYIEVGASVRNPLAYYQNNVANTITLLAVMRAHACNTLIFSSSCAVYGIPVSTPIDEEHPRNPISPYGHTKAMIEQIVDDCHQAYGLNYVALRYFNAAGALPQQGLRECHKPETHVIPLLIRAAYERTPFSLFGTDYDTPDGSCVRDFLHVVDIASAHLKALAYLACGGTSTVFNLGTASGISVKQMIHMVEQVTGFTIPIIERARRAGDPAILVANADKALEVLQWHPEHSNLEHILRSALPGAHVVLEGEQSVVS